MSPIDAPFETVVRPEVFNSQHEFDAKLVADALEVPSATVANAIGKPADTVRKRKNAPGLQDGLGRLGLIYSDLIAVQSRRTERRHALVQHAEPGAQRAGATANLTRAW